MKAKKIITIALIAVIAMTAAFAVDDNSRSVKVLGNVPETAYTTELRYGINDAAHNVVADQKITDENNTAWNLTKAGNTKSFFVTFKGNEVSSKTVTVGVEAASFTDGVTGHSTQVVYVDNQGTEDKEAATTLSATYTITAKRYAEATEAVKFNLYWNGDAAMDAGDYTSNVTISYSVN